MNNEKFNPKQHEVRLGVRKERKKEKIETFERLRKCEAEIHLNPF